MSGALGDNQVAMRTDPGFSIVRLGAGRGLSDVLDSVFDYGAFDPDSHHIKVKFGIFSVVLARALRTIAARH